MLSRDELYSDCYPYRSSVQHCSSEAASLGRGPGHGLDNSGPWTDIDIGSRAWQTRPDRKRSQADETGGTEGSLRRRAGADSEEARMGAAGGHRGLPHGGQGHSRAMRPPMPADHSPPTPADQSPPMLAGHSPAAVEARGGQTNQARPCFCVLKGLFSK